ncbi:hypothetical protein ACS0TY_029409 [Phlomoides rotata]
MALEAVIFQQDPYLYGCKDYNYNMAGDNYNFDLPQNLEQVPEYGYWECSPPSSAAQNTTSSSETCGGHGFFSGGGAGKPAAATHRKRRRTKPVKNKEEMENQRMTHIAVERNRRRQMNDYLAVLRSLMPPSYSQRGDQASIVGGAINFVKELEQLHQFLESHKLANQQDPNDVINHSNPFSNFFTFPQYSTSPTTTAAVDAAAERRSSIADVEVTVVESHANIKISTTRRPKQLLKIVAGFQSFFLTILHLNITTVDQSVLYSFSVKVCNYEVPILAL